MLIWTLRWGGGDGVRTGVEVRVHCEPEWSPTETPSIPVPACCLGEGQGQTSPSVQGAALTWFVSLHGRGFREARRKTLPGFHYLTCAWHLRQWFLQEPHEECFPTQTFSLPYPWKLILKTSVFSRKWGSLLGRKITTAPKFSLMKRREWFQSTSVSSLAYGSVHHIQSSVFNKNELYSAHSKEFSILSR